MEKSNEDTPQKESFKLISSDNYKECCGEIYVTKLDLLVVNCVLCDEKFGSFLSFCQHLAFDHFEERHIIEADEYHASKKKYAEEEEELSSIADYYESTILNNDAQPTSLDSIKDMSSNEEETHITSATELEEEQSSWNCSAQTRSKVKDEFPKLEIKHKRIIKTKERYLKSLDTIVRKREILKTSAERKFKCDICNGAFTDKSNMLAHRRRHTGQKDHQCYHCPKKFYTRSELKTHMCFHTRERPFICSTCGRGFLTSGAMTGHMRRHTNERRYKCEHCDKSFFDGKQLKDHTVTHTQERKHICEICSSAFLLSKTLKQHMKIHANKREYVCHICNAAYNQAPSLFLHMKKHGEKLHTNIDLK